MQAPVPSRRKSLKILYLTNCWPAGAAFGGQLRAINIGRALAQIGDVTCIPCTEDSTVAKAGDRVEGMTLARALVPIEQRNSGLMSRLRWALDSRYQNVHGALISEADQAWLRAEYPKYDLVWLLNGRTPNLTGIWRWENGHLDIDDIPSTYFRSYGTTHVTLRRRVRSRLDFHIARRRESHLLTRFNTLSVCSPDDRAHLGNDERIHVVPNGFTAPAAEPVRNVDRQAPRIGFIGLYNHKPNLEGVQWFLRECWPSILRAVPSARFRLVGANSDGPLRPTDPNVDALGWMADATAEINTWSIMVVPVRFGGGTRIKVAEAFSRKCPAVSTSLGAFGYGLESGKQLILADEAKDFSAACVRIINNPVLGDAMAETAWKEFLSKWTWDAIAPRIWKAAEASVERSRPRLA